MDLKNQILVALGLDKGEEVTMAWQGKSDDGTLFVSTAEELEEGADFSVLTEDGTTILAPIGTYRLDSGVSVRIEEEGVIAEIIQSETETEEVESLEVADDAFERLSERVQNLEDAIADLKGEVGDTESEEMADEESTIEVVEEVIANVEEAVKEIAAAIDDATPAEVTPELAVQAAEIAVEVLQEKAEEVVEEASETATTLKRKAKLSKLQKENIRLKAELAEAPASAPLDTNKFSSDKALPTKQDFKRMTKQEKFLYNLHN